MELLKMIDKVDINELGTKTRLEMEVDRFNKFQNMVFGEKPNIKKQKPAVDMRAYAKYVLREGSTTEKLELLANLRSRIIKRN